MKANKLIDHTLLKPQAQMKDIVALCQEAKQHDFKSVCINPCWIPVAKNELKGSDVLVCTVIGFPLGAMSTNAKVLEAKDAVDAGADEVDMVLNIGQLLGGNLEYVTNEIRLIKEAIGDKTLKVILETCLLTDEQIESACKCCMEAKADFVKTSTGFNTSGANVHVVEVMKRTVGDVCEVKAAGGVRTKEDLDAMVKAGATRIGTSNGCALVD